MTLTRLEQWELKLKGALDTVDARLEAKYSPLIPLHPRRPEAGRTSNRKYDGVFGIESKFTLGYASGNGPGYVIEIRTHSMTKIPHEVKSQILDDMEEMLLPALREAFPGKELQVKRIGDRFMMTGDLGFS